MTSTSGNDGSSTITVTFNLGRDLDAAQADVQNAVQSAMGRLPARSLRKRGVVVQKSTPAIILGVGLQSDGRITDNALSDFAEHRVIDALKLNPERRRDSDLWIAPVRDAHLAGSTKAGDGGPDDSRTSSGHCRVRTRKSPREPLGSEPAGSGQYSQVQLNAHGRLLDARSVCTDRA